MIASPPVDPGVPIGQGADRPPEERGVERDGVRLLVSGPKEDRPYRFMDLADVLRPGDLLVVNESATLPASLPARSTVGEFRMNVSTDYGGGLWVAEPRWGPGSPGPLSLDHRAPIDVAGVACSWVADFPGIRRLMFLRARGDLREAMYRAGSPIRYGYAAREFPLQAYQTAFARVPGSAEMPSAARPFTRRLLDRLAARGVGVAPILLHAGVSSLELGDFSGGAVPVFPEPFEVPASTVSAIERARTLGGRVVAVGTTVVRALESADDGCRLRPARGFTRLYLSPDHPVRSVDALLTGFHEAQSTHLALLSAFVGAERIRRSYAVAAREGFLWHEFGDSHLLFAGDPHPAAAR